MRMFFVVAVFLAVMVGSAFADLGSVASGIQAAPSLSTDSLISAVMSIIGEVKGSVPVGAKIAGLVLVLIALLKVSFLKPIWDKLGAVQAFLAPTLGLAVGLLLFGVKGGVTVASVLAYMASGGGALMLHELLDGVKAIPGIGPTYVAIINAVESVLGGASSSSS